MNGVPSPAPGREAMRRTLRVTLLLLLLLAVAGGLGGCSLVEGLRPATTAPIPDDPRVSAAVETARPSVVEIRATSAMTALVQEVGLGTGVIVRTDGLVVTNDHVITLSGDAGMDAEGERLPAEKIEVRLHDGSRLEATVVGRAPGYDLAFLAVDAVDLPAAAFIDDLDDVEEGALAVAIGASSNLERPVTVGQVTAVLHNVHSSSLPELTVLIESNVPLDQGNSGGPLLDEYGRVMGINVAVALRNGEGMDEDGGSSLAIPAPVVLDTLAALEGR